MDNICEKCGKEVKIGDFPFCPHESVTDQQFHRPFVPYYSLSAGAYIESYAAAKRLEKERNYFERRRPNRNFTEV